jgi:hypothetical protein
MESHYMFKSNKLNLCCFVIFILLSLSVAKGTEDGTNGQVDHPRQLLAAEERDPKKILESSFSSATTPQLAWGWKVVVGATVAGGFSFLAYQGGMPLWAIGQDIIGFTPALIPDGTPAANALVAWASIQLLPVGIERSFNAVFSFFNRSTATTVQAQEKVHKKRIDYSKLERLSCFFPPKNPQGLKDYIKNLAQPALPAKLTELFWLTGLGCSFLFYIEGQLSGNTLGLPPIAYELIFSAGWFIISFPTAFNQETHPAKNYLLRQIFDSPHRKRLMAEAVRPIEGTQEVIRYQGLTDSVKGLGVALRVFEDYQPLLQEEEVVPAMPYPAEVQQVEIPLGDEEEAEEERDYEAALKAMKAIAKGNYEGIWWSRCCACLPSCFRGWVKIGSTVSKVASPAIGAMSAVGKAAIIDRVFYELLSFGFSPESAALGGHICAGLTSPLIILTTIESIPYIQEELDQIWRFLKSKDTVGTTGGRIPTVLTRSATIVGIVLPLSNHIRLHGFNERFGMSYETGMVFTAFFAFDLEARFAQRLVGPSYDAIFNWVSTGFQANRRRFCLLHWVDPDLMREKALAVQTSLGLYKRNTQELSDEYLEILLNKPGNNFATI